MKNIKGLAKQIQKEIDKNGWSIDSHIKHFIREFICGCKIEVYLDKGYELHTGYGWGRVVITDKRKYNDYCLRNLSSLPRKIVRTKKNVFE